MYKDGYLEHLRPRLESSMRAAEGGNETTGVYVCVCVIL